MIDATMYSGNSIKKLLVSTAMAGFVLALAPAAFAQSNYYIGVANMRDPVIVDLSVLDELGQESNLADLLRTGPVVISSGSPATQRLVPEPPLPNPAPSTFVATAIAPAAAVVEPGGIPQSGLEPAGVARKAEREADKLSGKAAAPVLEPVQTGAVEIPKAASVADVDPVDHAAEPVAVAVAAPEPVAVEPEPVAVATPPEPVPEPEAVETVAVEIPEIEAPEVVPEVAVIVPEAESDLTSSIVPPPEPVAEVEPEPVVEPAIPEASVTLDLPEPSAQVASIDPNAVVESAGSIEIRFGPASSELPAGVEAALDRLAGRMETEEGLRIQLMGFANNAGETASQARRLSLFRALAVRTYLIKKGIRSTRMDVRALGNKIDGGAPNRVDVVAPQG